MATFPHWQHSSEDDRHADAVAEDGQLARARVAEAGAFLGGARRRAAVDAKGLLLPVDVEPVHLHAAGVVQEHPRVRAVDVDDRLPTERRLVLHLQDARARRRHVRGVRPRGRRHHRERAVRHREVAARGADGLQPVVQPALLREAHAPLERHAVRLTAAAAKLRLGVLVVVDQVEGGRRGARDRTAGAAQEADGLVVAAQIDRRAGKQDALVLG